MIIVKCETTQGILLFGPLENREEADNWIKSHCQHEFDGALFCDRGVRPSSHTTFFLNKPSLGVKVK